MLAAFRRPASSKQPVGEQPRIQRKELVDAVLKQMRCRRCHPTGFGTSEVFRIHGTASVFCSFDEGATLLLSLKDRAFTTGHQMRDAVLFGLRLPYAPRYTGRFSDSTSVRCP